MRHKFFILIPLIYETLKYVNKKIAYEIITSAWFITSTWNLYQFEKCIMQQYMPLEKKNDNLQWNFFIMIMQWYTNVLYSIDKMQSYPMDFPK